MRAYTASMMERPVNIPDVLVYRLASADRMASIIARVSCEEGLGDRVAWHLILGDDGAIRRAREAHGEKAFRSKRRRQTSQRALPGVVA